MTLTLASRGTGAVALALALCAFTTQPLTPSQQALAAHYTNNDPGWTLLRQATVSEDRAKGLLTARFTPDLQRLSGKAFQISGFMTPLEASGQTRHFIITRRSTTCPFCPPNEPTEAVEVRLDQPTSLSNEEVVVRGRMTLVATSDEGLFYSLSSATMLRDQHRS